MGIAQGGEAYTGAASQTVDPSKLQDGLPESFKDDDFRNFAPRFR